MQADREGTGTGAKEDEESSEDEEDLKRRAVPGGGSETSRRSPGTKKSGATKLPWVMAAADTSENVALARLAVREAFAAQRLPAAPAHMIGTINATAPARLCPGRDADPPAATPSCSGSSTSAGARSARPSRA
mmetsp:Transcript_47956/g.123381  ORF Transcript_47956/g.123381 Transcript_47956/m.123381 type:complete len:133 (-) Transcript_47956:98-496(-)